MIDDIYIRRSNTAGILYVIMFWLFRILQTTARHTRRRVVTVANCRHFPAGSRSVAATPPQRWVIYNLKKGTINYYYLNFAEILTFYLSNKGFTIKISKLKVKYLSKKTWFMWFRCNHMIHIHSIPSQFLLSSPLNPKYITPPNETVTCVCADLTSLADIYINWNWNTHLCV